MAEASVLHIAIPFFKAQALEYAHPNLQAKAFIVGQTSNDRAPVLEVSAAAWQMGVRSGGRVTDLQQRWAIALEIADAQAERRLQKDLEAICARFSPWMEPACGCVSLDLRGGTRLFGSAFRCALLIRETLRKELGIKVGLGVAANSTAAQLALAVAGPGGLLHIAAGSEAQFLAPQGLELIGSYNRQFFERCAALGFETLGEIAALDSEAAVNLLGKKGLEMRSLARGEVPEQRPKSQVHTEHNFIESMLDEDSCDPIYLRGLAIRLGTEGARSMRYRGQGCGELILELVYSDGFVQSLSQRCKSLWTMDKEIIAVFMDLLGRLQGRRVRIKMLRLGFARLAASAFQADFFADTSLEARRRWQTVLDHTGRRFGRAAPLPLSSLYRGL